MGSCMCCTVDDFTQGEFRNPRAHVVNTSDKRIGDYYDWDNSRQIGTGTCSYVYRAKERKLGGSNKVEHAVKKILRSDGDSRVQNEIERMYALDHPNILKLLKHFEDDQCTYLVMEICEGGDLFDIVSQSAHTEQQSAGVMHQLFCAVAYMHKNEVCHRDLRPENLMLSKKAPLENNVLKVIDFGDAALLDKPGVLCSTKVGTAYYSAPEVLAIRGTRYGLECDMWSCGVIMYVLLSGRLPFKGFNEKTTVNKVLDGTFDFPRDLFANVSQAATNLISRLLSKVPQQRCTANQAVTDQWTKMTDLPQTRIPLDSAATSLRACVQTNHFQQVALHTIARHSTSRVEQDRLRDIFLQLDLNQDGTVTADELKQGLVKAGISDQLMSQIAQVVDIDGSGAIDYTEFLAAAMDRRKMLEESACWSAFTHFDKNNDKFIERSELEEVLKSPLLGDAWDMQTRDLDEIMQKLDTNKDDRISYSEFKNALKNM